MPELGWVPVLVKSSRFLYLFWMVIVLREHDVRCTFFSPVYYRVLLVVAVSLAVIEVLICGLWICSCHLRGRHRQALRTGKRDMKFDALVF